MNLMSLSMTEMLRASLKSFYCGFVEQCNAGVQAAESSPWEPEVAFAADMPRVWPCWKGNARAHKEESLCLCRWFGWISSIYCCWLWLLIMRDHELHIFQRRTMVCPALEKCKVSGLNGIPMISDEGHGEFDPG